MKNLLLLLLMITLNFHQLTAQIIDVHMHGWSSDFKDRGTFFGYPSAKTADDLLAKTIQKMDEHNIQFAVLSGTLESLEKYTKADSRFIPSYSDRKELIPITQFEELVKSGKIKVFGEITAVYKGTNLTDSIYQPYLKICEQNGIPVAYHSGGSSPTAQRSWPKYRIYHGDPLLIEDVLANYPKLKVNLMHAGGVFYEHTLRMMGGYRNLYADLGILLWTTPRSKDYVKKFLVSAKEYGVLDRVLFGSDQMMWPDAITASIEYLNSLDFLTEEEKRMILYDNGKKFLNIHE